MSDKAIRQALEGTLKSLCDGLVPKILTSFQNVAFTPKIGVPYVQCFILPAKTLDPSIGASHVRKVGIFQISAYFPVNEGSANIGAFKDSVENTFYRGRSIKQDTFWITIDSTPSCTTSSVQNGWYIMHISVDYRMEILKPLIK